jgi:phospholipase/carboxylesterase
MNRRAFLRYGAAGTVGLIAARRGVKAQAPAPAAAAEAPRTTESGIPYGESRLDLPSIDDDNVDIVNGPPDDGMPKRGGSVYVPKSYKDGEIMPLLVMLHGLGGDALRVRSAYPLAEEFGVIVLAPESRGLTWGQHAPGFDKDGTYIADAMRFVAKSLYVDSDRVGIAGVSDGATYAIAMGIAYGDFFTHVIGFSEGIIIPFRKQGKPKIFIGHGTEDAQMPIDITSRKFVPQYKADGYDVTYQEYDGGHGMPAPVLRQAFEWFVGKPPQPK